MCCPISVCIIYSLSCQGLVSKNQHSHITIVCVVPFFHMHILVGPDSFNLCLCTQYPEESTYWFFKTWISEITKNLKHSIKGFYCYTRDIFHYYVPTLFVRFTYIWLLNKCIIIVFRELYCFELYETPANLYDLVMSAAITSY